MKPRSMKLPSALLTCLVLHGCGKPSSAPSPGYLAADLVLAAKSLNARAAQDCPWPADVARYEQTTLIARNRLTPTPSLGVFDTLKYGCSIITFTLDDAGNVAMARAGQEYPAGFGAVAKKVLHWNDYAVGASSLTIFMVRVAAQTLPQGGALTSLTFKDSVINLEVPP